MLRVMRAIASVKNHIKKFNNGALMTFAHNLWLYNNPVSMPRMFEGLKYIENWMNTPGYPETNQELLELNQVIKSIQNIPPFFPGKVMSFNENSVNQEALEDHLLDGVTALENLNRDSVVKQENESVAREIATARLKLDGKKII